MADYTHVPDSVLYRMAEHSGIQLAYWERSVAEHRKALESSEYMVNTWRLQRDEQYQALDERDMLAPDHPESP